MSDEDTQSTETAEAVETETVEVDLEAENRDLRAMITHYAPDANIEDLLSNNFSRAGKFIAPQPSASPEPEKKVSNPRTVTRRVPAATDNGQSQTKPRAKAEVGLNPNGNMASVDAFNLATSLQTMTSAERTALLAGVRITA